MKKIKSISILLEQGPPDLSALQSGTITTPTKQPTDGKGRRTRKDDTNTDTDTNPAPTDTRSELKAKEPWVSLLKLPGSILHDQDGVKVGKDKTVKEPWPWAVSWTSTGGEVYNPASKTPVKADKAYIFKTEGGNEVLVQWKKSETDTPYLYSGSYTIGSGKLTITGLGGQSEIIDLASGKIEKSNVSIVPSSELELNAVISSFARRSINLSWYFYMRMYNLKTESPALYSLIKTKLESKGYEVFTEPDSYINIKKMTVDAKKFRTVDVGYWPVASKIYSQFAPGIDSVPFASITDLGNSVVGMKGNPAKSATFTSGYDYITYKVEKALQSKNFDTLEAKAFYSILLGLSQSALATLNSYASTAGLAIPNNLSLSNYILGEVSSNQKEIYDKYIAPLQSTNGKYFPVNTLEADGGKGSGDEAWFKSISDLNALGGDILEKALNSIPAAPAKVEVKNPNDPSVGGYPSDSRLKENIDLIGKSDSGINIYSFKYKDKDGYYQGVMAQELIGTPFESAVILSEDFYSVNYDLIDVEFKQI